MQVRETKGVVRVGLKPPDILWQGHLARHHRASVQSWRQRECQAILQYGISRPGGAWVSSNPTWPDHEQVRGPTKEGTNPNWQYELCFDVTSENRPLRFWFYDAAATEGNGLIGGYEQALGSVVLTCSSFY